MTIQQKMPIFQIQSAFNEKNARNQIQWAFKEKYAWNHIITQTVSKTLSKVNRTKTVSIQTQPTSITYPVITFLLNQTLYYISYHSIHTKPCAVPVTNYSAVKTVSEVNPVSNHVHQIQWAVSNQSKSNDQFQWTKNSEQSSSELFQSALK